ncbi:hypothetical protein SAMD00019534_005950 [Acytostelium subglobosum LB1]|uniref:hypothetical protein n=1 Tax=Acytostelium subglobosum LB1 TaxID=1410327 RepID=UPI000644E55A|nr:hypothetical protein SAMD00019534_005950 [Acytostelium subglobosum LB1]GAM17420.1 hypothetical protein SAMD00019534_005950 [Acytostelium subglobosum LB1]|eukprot:XP_012759482.1 hypothetical protein SAMD00019534_005950 [Acytostelium subglobosum LB1]
MMDPFDDSDNVESDNDNNNNNNNNNNGKTSKKSTAKATVPAPASKMSRIAFLDTRNTDTGGDKKRQKEKDLVNRKDKKRQRKDIDDKDLDIDKDKNKDEDEDKDKDEDEDHPDDGGDDDGGGDDGGDDGDENKSDDEYKNNDPVKYHIHIPEETGVYIWGTRTKVQDVQTKFRNFIHNFRLKRRPRADDIDEDDVEPRDDDEEAEDEQDKDQDMNGNGHGPYQHQSLYLNLLEQLHVRRGRHLNINFRYLVEFDKELHGLWIRYPNELIPLLDQEINAIYQEMYPDDDMEDSGDSRLPIELHPFNLDQVRPMRQLNPSDIDQIIAIRGLIIRTSAIIPTLVRCFFQCSNCGACAESDVVKQKVIEPATCTNTSCKAKASMKLVHNRCTFGEKQFVKLQETPDAIPEGETPHTVSMFIHSELIDIGKPGDRVEITGVFKANPSKSSATTQYLRAIYKTYIDVVHIKKIEKVRNDEGGNGSVESNLQLMESLDDVEITLEREKELKELSQRSDIYDLVTRSLAPSIWELEDIKKGILCQLFGGSNKNFQEEGGNRIRGDINILLCGDPGTSKSQMLSFVHKIAPRGIYTSGKGSSAVGLTAYITRDPDTRETVLESGALVLSDQGVCCIDEFDKMSDHTRSILHEAMEQQTVSVAKAGIICTLNARTSILASANPKESRYNPRLSVVENLQLPPTLLSRFDLIYLVLDKPNERSDRHLSRHIVSLFWAEKPIPEWHMPHDLLSDYIAFARKKIHPKIREDSVESLVNGYLEMRARGGGKTITATPRQLESLIRIAEAHAKIRYSPEVEPVDVAEAIRLVKVALQQAAIDPHTGTIDMDLITTGRSASSREEIGRVKDAIIDVFQSSDPSSGTPEQLFKRLMASAHNSSKSSVSFQHVTVDDVREAFKQLEEEESVRMNDNVIKNKSDVANTSMKLVHLNKVQKMLWPVPVIDVVRCLIDWLGLLMILFIAIVKYSE